MIDLSQELVEETIIELIKEITDTLEMDISLSRISLSSARNFLCYKQWRFNT